MTNRFFTYWVYGGSLSGMLLCALLPALAAVWPPSMLAVFAQLPVYMLHQWEEHDADRFRRFVNQNVAKGREALSPAAVWAINVPGVWGVNLASFYLALEGGVGWGLIAIYLTLVNATVHILASLATRTYNPGVISAIALFLPVGIWSWLTVVDTGQVQATHHTVGLGAAILIHVAIVAHVKLRAAVVENNE